MTGAAVIDIARGRLTRVLTSTSTTDPLLREAMGVDQRGAPPPSAAPKPPMSEMVQLCELSMPRRSVAVDWMLRPTEPGVRSSAVTVERHWESSPAIGKLSAVR